MDNDNDRECVVCMDSIRDYMCLPCGHVCLCDKCAAFEEYNINNNNNVMCPRCRQKVDKIVKVYV